jgi:hypothetical protein
MDRRAGVPDAAAVDCNGQASGSGVAEQPSMPFCILQHTCITNEQMRLAVMQEHIDREAGQKGAGHALLKVAIEGRQSVAVFAAEAEDLQTPLDADVGA